MWINQRIMGITILGVMVAAIVGILGASQFLPYWICFIALIVGLTMLVLVTIRLLYLWLISKYLVVIRIVDGDKFYNPERASIIITNGNHDLDNFFVKLERLYRVGLPSSFPITNRDPVFVKKEKIPANESVVVDIGEAVVDNKGKHYMKFLVDGNLFYDFAVYDTDKYLKEPPDPRGGKWLGSFYELVIRVSGGIDQDRINQLYLMRIYNIQVNYEDGKKVDTMHVLGIRKFSRRKDGQRYKFMAEGRLYPNGLTADGFWEAFDV